jgi:hypothetical protein
MSNDKRRYDAEAEKLIRSLKKLRPAPAKRAPTRLAAKIKPARKPARAPAS